MCLPSSRFVYHMGTIVRGECGEVTHYIDDQARKGRIVILPGSIIAPLQFAEILHRYELGLGESECILHADERDLTICTDDKAARAAALSYLGNDRVVGSLRLVRECVCAGITTSHQAYVGYESMRAKGAFLPDMDASYFDC